MLYTLQLCLQYQSPTEVRLAGTETLSGVLVYHVVCTPKPAVAMHFWIESGTVFRVHREEVSFGQSTVECVSEYGRNESIPDRVTEKKFSNGKVLEVESETVVIAATYNRPVGDDVGTLASLEMPSGTPVTDERIGQRLGYWDGTEIVPEYEKAIRNDEQRRDREAKRQYLKWGAIAVGFTIAAAVVLFGRRRLQKLKAK